MEKKLKSISKFMSFVLRHKPEQIGLELDENGWADVNELISKMNATGNSIDRAMIDEIVRSNDKKRFAFNEDQTKIRASQGHSVEIDLGLTAIPPPENLYHGTSEKNANMILTEGIKKMERQHVHLSPDKETAKLVGARHGKPVVFTIQAGQMHRDGHLFYLSANGVWLTDYIEVKYISA